MKKTIFFIAAAVAMVITMTTFSSCKKEDSQVMILQVVSNVSSDLDIDDASIKQINSSIFKMDNRLIEMFGSSFSVECDDNLNPKLSVLQSMSERIVMDKQIFAELNKLQALKKKDGKNAVYEVTFLYNCGSKTVYTYPVRFAN